MQVAIRLVLVAALEFIPLFVQESVVQGTLHNVWHAACVTCQ